MNERYARGELQRICKLLYDRQLTVSAGGNMSIRLDDSTYLITPSGRNKGMLEIEDFVVIDSKGKALTDGKPSLETKFHVALYNMNSDTNAVIHCHPLHCVTLAVKGENIKSNITPEGVILLGNVPMLDYYTPGSKQLVEAVKAHGNCKAMLMARHGALTQGRSLEEAFNRMEELEFQAKLQLMCGEVEDLPIKEIKKLSKM